jgi:hypothetical protein
VSETDAKALAASAVPFKLSTQEPFVFTRSYPRSMSHDATAEHGPVTDEGGAFADARTGVGATTAADVRPVAMTAVISSARTQRAG